MRNRNLLSVKKICATGIICVIVIMMYIELRMHNFFIAEQWRGNLKQKPMWYRQRGMVRVLLIAVQIIQKLTLYCNTMRNYELQTQNNYNCLTIDTVATMFGLITYASYIVNNQY